MSLDGERKPNYKREVIKKVKFISVELFTDKVTKCITRAQNNMQGENIHEKVTTQSNV